MVKGTKIREVQPQQLKEEIKIYGECGVDEEEEVKKKLKELRKRYLRQYSSKPPPPSKRDRSNFLAEIVDSMKMLLDDQEAPSDEPPDA